MDILTQMVLGGAVSSQILKNEKPGKAIIVGSIIAALPDLDVFFMYKLGALEELIMHRSFSHAILPFLILSFFFVLFNKATFLFRNTGIKRLFACVFFVLFTHALLDCLTTWGTQLFWPYDLRLATQTVYVIDLFYSIPLGTGLALYFLFPGKKWSFRINRWTLILSTVYLVFLIVYQQSLILKFSNNENFEEALRINTQPQLFSPLNYRMVIEFQDTFYISKELVDIFHQGEIHYYTLPKNLNYITEISQYMDLYPLYNLARGYLSIDKTQSNIYRLRDLRYGPVDKKDNNYESVFTYYIEIHNGEANFKQNMRTYERLKQLFLKIFF